MPGNIICENAKIQNCENAKVTMYNAKVRTAASWGFPAIAQLPCLGICGQD